MAHARVTRSKRTGRRRQTVLQSRRDRVRDRFAFRPLAPGDLPTLHEWLQRPHVAQWWRSPRTVAEVESEYVPVALGQSTTRAYIALLDGQPIGFIQSYVVRDSGSGWWEHETDPGARGIDQFLCNAVQFLSTIESRDTDRRRRRRRTARDARA